MKKLIYLMVLFSTISYSQTNIENTNTSTIMPSDAPNGTYLKDVDNTFAPFIGTWKYQNGNEILIIKLEKVTQYLYTEYGNYEDFIKGNYSYSIDGGLTYIVDTITTNLGDDNPNTNSLYSSGPNSNTKVGFAFRDVVYDKDNCRATFKFVMGSTTELELKLTNNFRGYIYPETPPNLNFSIPNNVVLVKQ